MQRLRQLLVWIGVNDGNMEEGSLRCDANVSVRPRGQTELGVKVEVKNMNSFRAVYLALEYEIQRQQAALLNGETIVQETRGWNEARGLTVGQRSKEFAHDYRYFPEPDIPPMVISRELVERVRAELPELPATRAERLTQALGLTAYNAAQLTADLEIAEYFEALVAIVGEGNATEAANWVIGEVNRARKGPGAGIDVPAAALGALITRKLDGTISNNQAKTLFTELVNNPEVVGSAEVDALVEKLGMRQVTDSSQLEAWVEAAIAAQPQAADDFRAGNDRAVGRLVGAVMQASGGKANGPAVSEMLRQKLRP